MNVFASKVLMIRPQSFRPNEETSESNNFQKNISFHSALLKSAQDEHSALKNLLEQNGLTVSYFEEPAHADTPDALFPNNWFCSLPDGRFFLFPMLTENRRREVRFDIIETIAKGHAVIDLRHLAKKSLFLEGTGSLIFDHSRRTAYACLSARTSLEALDEFRNISGYEVLSFSATDSMNIPIYHTNVMLALGENTAILFADGIRDTKEQQRVVQEIQSGGRKIIFINEEQLKCFAGNMLFLKSSSGKKFWIGSSGAVNSLAPEQRKLLMDEGEILHSSLKTIEDVGGGGVRCLLAEIY